MGGDTNKGALEEIHDGTGEVEVPIIPPRESADDLARKLRAIWNEVSDELGWARLTNYDDLDEDVGKEFGRRVASRFADWVAVRLPEQGQIAPPRDLLGYETLLINGREYATGFVIEAVENHVRPAPLAAAPQPEAVEGPKACPTCGGSREIIGFDEAYQPCPDCTGRIPAPTPSACDDDRPCTCHPDDNPPVPCPRKYALDECRKAARDTELPSRAEQAKDDVARFRSAIRSRDTEGDVERALLEWWPPGVEKQGPIALCRIGAFRAGYRAALSVSADEITQLREALRLVTSHDPDWLVSVVKQHAAEGKTR